MDAKMQLPMNVYMRDQYTLKKSNLLIEKINTFSFNTHKIFNLILWEFQHQETPAVSVKIPVHKLVELVGQKEVYRTRLFYQKIAKNLVQKTLDLIEPQEDAVDITNLISRFTLEKGMVEIRVTDEFLQLVDIHKIAALEKQQEKEAQQQTAFLKSQGKKVTSPPKKKSIAKYGYTKLNLSIINALKSKHSMMLYEYLLMKLNFHTFKRYDRDTLKLEIEVDTLRKMLCHYQKSYENFDLFRRKILKPALDEINQKTDLNIDIELLKQCKKVQSIAFSIRRKEDVLLEINGVSGIIVPDVAQQAMLEYHQQMIDQANIHPSQLPPSMRPKHAKAEIQQNVASIEGAKNASQSVSKKTSQLNAQKPSLLDETGIQNEGLKAAILALKEAPNWEKDYQEAKQKHQKTQAEHHERMAKINEARERGVAIEPDFQDAFQPINGLLAKILGDMTEKVKTNENKERVNEANAEVAEITEVKLKERLNEAFIEAFSHEFTQMDMQEFDAPPHIDNIDNIDHKLTPTTTDKQLSRSEKRRLANISNISNTSNLPNTPQANLNDLNQATQETNSLSTEALPYKKNEQDPVMLSDKNSRPVNQSHDISSLSTEALPYKKNEQDPVMLSKKKNAVQSKIIHQEQEDGRISTKLEVQAEGVKISHEQSTKLRHDKSTKSKKSNHAKSAQEKEGAQEIEYITMPAKEVVKYHTPSIVQQYHPSPALSASASTSSASASMTHQTHQLADLPENADPIEKAYLEHYQLQAEMSAQLKAKASERAARHHEMMNSPAARLVQLNTKSNVHQNGVQSMEQVFLNLCIMKKQAEESINEYHLPDDILMQPKYQIIAQAKNLKVLCEKIRDALWQERKKCVKAIEQGAVDYIKMPPSRYHLQFNYPARVDFGFNLEVLDLPKLPYNSLGALMTRLHENEVLQVIFSVVHELKRDLDNYQHQMLSAKISQEVDPQQLNQARRVLTETYNIPESDLHTHMFENPERRLLTTHNIMKDQYSHLGHQACKRLATKIYNDISIPQLNDPFASRNYDTTKVAHAAFEEKMSKFPTLKELLRQELSGIEERKQNVEKYTYFQHGLEQPWHIFHHLWHGFYEKLSAARLPNMNVLLDNIVVYFEDENGHTMLTDEQFKYNQFNNPTVYVKLPSNSRKEEFQKYLSSFFRETLASVGIEKPYHVI
jgi:hypothetical protein